MKSPKTKYLTEYTPYPFTVSTIHLQVELHPTQTRVVSRLHVQRNPQAHPPDAPLELNGEHLKLVEVKLNNHLLAESGYTYNDKLLTIPEVPDTFEITIETIVSPETNTALEGLYRSSGNYCTQCEAEGFRRITCYPDRPDVMAVFTTTIIADASACPVLLSNGNLVDKGVLDDGRHFRTWHDPFPKPSYLFALVAGDLVCIKDSFTTMSGREVALHIFVEERNRNKCDHAMQSLKKAMLWDEQRFGREYDLDVYMIVAVDDFNMGAMENKGLNVFNSKYVLAEPATATDMDYEGIEGVIAHEYFHNWTGNRITCRDWFQLSLKEGLTVFRDQEFSADMGSRAVKRINDANVMRSFQFREDSGPMAHPVRPESFVEINNFYTLTVYNKGAEVIRMMHTLLGEKGFRQGMDLYFERHDGQAVTCEDFVAAMEDATGADLSQFSLWYSQAGTPELTATCTYAPRQQTLCLHLQQTCPPTPGQTEKKPFYFPVAFGLLDNHGHEIYVDDKNYNKSVRNIIIVNEESQEFIIKNIREKPVVSLLRNFSAPVKLQSNLSDQNLAFLMAHDTDPFTRWDAGQQLGLTTILQGITRFQHKKNILVPPLFSTAFGQLLADRQTDPAFIAVAVLLPSETWIGQQMQVIDPEAVYYTRSFFAHQLAREHKDILTQRYAELSSEKPYCYSTSEAAKRSLRNRSLAYLLTPEPGKELEEHACQPGITQYIQADNMTDVFAALAAVVNANLKAGAGLLDDFYQQWSHDPLVVDKWLTLQATCTLPGTLQRVKKLLNHSAFSIKNPNKVRSLIGAFCSNQHQFHALDGSGYTFLTNQILTLDSINPQIASRLVTPLTMWKRYDPARSQLMRDCLEQIASSEKLSGDVAEIVQKSLL